MNALDDPSVATGDAVDPALLAEANAAIAGVDVPLAPPAGAPTDHVDRERELAEDSACLSGLLEVTFNQALAPRIGDHWKLQSDECASLGKAYATLLGKYFPNWRTGPELTAIVITFAVFGPRAATSYRLARDAATKEAAPAGVAEPV